MRCGAAAARAGSPGWGRGANVLRAERQRRCCAAPADARERRRAERERRQRAARAAQRQETLQAALQHAETALDAAALALQPVDCRAARDAFTSQQGVALSTENIAEVVEEAECPVFIDCWAPDCADSPAQTAALEALVRRVNAEQSQPACQLVSLRCDVEQSLALHFGVRALPAVIGVEGGRVQGQLHRPHDDSTLAELVLGVTLKPLKDLPPGDAIRNLLEGHAALRAEDWPLAWEHFGAAYLVASAAAGEALAEIGEHSATAARAAVGLAAVRCAQMEHGEVLRLLGHVDRDLAPAARCLADVERASAIADILVLADVRPGMGSATLAVADADADPELPLRLAAAPFLEGDFERSLRSCCVAAAAPGERGEVATLMFARLLRYLGPKYPGVQEAAASMEGVLRARGRSDFTWAARAAGARERLATSSRTPPRPLELDRRR
eukprot:TRINITY_DN41866_c0_g1_i1.p1 TRINITY_DN41866_c0_g1~~TRINITY_DN41866_c0_g1_i1.p1  ORF type:complete len:467 (+),score=120.69 TRINITY_DN41866_c0_g1_i1:75-1403(+)